MTKERLKYGRSKNELFFLFLLFFCEMKTVWLKKKERKKSNGQFKISFRVTFASGQFDLIDFRRSAENRKNRAEEMRDVIRRKGKEQRAAGTYEKRKKTKSGRRTRNGRAQRMRKVICSEEEIQHRPFATRCRRCRIDRPPKSLLKGDWLCLVRKILKW